MISHKLEADQTREGDNFTLESYQPIHPILRVEKSSDNTGNLFNKNNSKLLGPCYFSSHNNQLYLSDLCLRNEFACFTGNLLRVLMLNPLYPTYYPLKLVGTNPYPKDGSFYRVTRQLPLMPDLEDVELNDNILIISDKEYLLNSAPIIDFTRLLVYEAFLGENDWDRENYKLQQINDSQYTIIRLDPGRTGLQWDFIKHNNNNQPVQNVEKIYYNLTDLLHHFLRSFSLKKKLYVGPFDIFINSPRIEELNSIFNQKNELYEALSMLINFPKNILRTLAHRSFSSQYHSWVDEKLLPGILNLQNKYLQAALRFPNFDSFYKSRNDADNVVMFLINDAIDEFNLLTQENYIEKNEMLLSSLRSVMHFILPLTNLHEDIYTIIQKKAIEINSSLDCQRSAQLRLFESSSDISVPASNTRNPQNK